MENRKKGGKLLKLHITHRGITSNNVFGSFKAKEITNRMNN